MGLEDRNAQQDKEIVVEKFIDPIGALQMKSYNYVVRALGGLTAKASVRLATAAALPAVTAAGTGVGKTLTADAVGVLTVDGVATALNDRILVKNQVAGKDNGIYKVTTEGAAGVAFILTRAVDDDQNAESVSGVYISVTAGTVGANKDYALTTVDPMVVDTTPLVFELATSDFTITLPPVAEAKGRIYSITGAIVTAVNVITIAHKGDSEGWTNLVLDTAGDGALLYSDGRKWWNIGGVIA